MSQCHDQYPSFPETERPASEVTELQCHDYYAEGQLEPDHACRIFVDHSDTDPVCVVRVIGRLDWATASHFHDVVAAQASEGPVAIDLTLAHLDSAGNGILLSTISAAHHRNQPMALVVRDPVEAEVLSMLQVDDIVPVVASLPEARRCVAGATAR